MGRVRLACVVSSEKGIPTSVAPKHVAPTPKCTLFYTQIVRTFFTVPPATVTILGSVQLSTTRPTPSCPSFPPPIVKSVPGRERGRESERDTAVLLSRQVKQAARRAQCHSWQHANARAHDGADAPLTVLCQDGRVCLPAASLLHPRPGKGGYQRRVRTGLRVPVAQAPELIPPPRVYLQTDKHSAAAFA